jgi:hypothetical protein
MKDYVGSHGMARHTPPIHAEVTSPAGIFIDGEVLDIDMAGVRMVSSRDLPVGTECTVTLVLEDQPGAVRVRLHGEVAEADDTGMAIVFRETAEDRIEHLQDLVSHCLAAPRERT